MIRRQSGIRAIVAALVGVSGAAWAEQPAVTGQSPMAATVPAPGPKRTLLSRTDVPGSNQEVVYALVEVPAHAEVARHTHPGTVFGYLLEGDYTMMIDGQPARTLQPGEWLQVPSGVPHAERSGERPARLLAIFTVEKGKPLTTPAP